MKPASRASEKYLRELLQNGRQKQSAEPQYFCSHLEIYRSINIVCKTRKCSDKVTGVKIARRPYQVNVFQMMHCSGEFKRQNHLLPKVGTIVTRGNGPISFMLPARKKQGTITTFVLQKESQNPGSKHGPGVLSGFGYFASSAACSAGRNRIGCPYLLRDVGPRNTGRG